MKMNELILRLSDVEYIKIMTKDGVDFTEVDYRCGDCALAGRTNNAESK